MWKTTRQNCNPMSIFMRVLSSLSGFPILSARLNMPSYCGRLRSSLLSSNIYTCIGHMMPHLVLLYEQNPPPPPFPSTRTICLLPLTLTGLSLSKSQRLHHGLVVGSTVGAMWPRTGPIAVGLIGPCYLTSVSSRPAVNAPSSGIKRSLVYIFQNRPSQNHIS